MVNADTKILETLKGVTPSSLMVTKKRGDNEMANMKPDREELIDRMEYCENGGGKPYYRVLYDNNYYYAEDTYVLVEKALWEMKNNPSIT